jgi:hypothetical protein
MDTLKDTVLSAMAGYARKGLNSHSYLTHNDDNTILSVVTVPQRENAAFMSLLVRILADKIVIERDQNDKPLVDVLVQAGIPRNQIILAYAGEPAPEAVA